MAGDETDVCGKPILPVTVVVAKRVVIRDGNEKDTAVDQLTIPLSVAQIRVKPKLIATAAAAKITATTHSSS